MSSLTLNPAGPRFEVLVRPPKTTKKTLTYSTAVQSPSNDPHLCPGCVRMCRMNDGRRASMTPTAGPAARASIGRPYEMRP